MKLLLNIFLLQYDFHYCDCQIDFGEQAKHDHNGKGCENIWKNRHCQKCFVGVCNRIASWTRTESTCTCQKAFFLILIIIVLFLSGGSLTKENAQQNEWCNPQNNSNPSDDTRTPSHQNHEYEPFLYANIIFYFLKNGCIYINLNKKNYPITRAKPAAAKMIGQQVLMSLNHSCRSSMSSCDDKPSILLRRNSDEGKQILPKTAELKLNKRLWRKSYVR